MYIILSFPKVRAELYGKLPGTSTSADRAGRSTHLDCPIWGKTEEKEEPWDAVEDLFPFTYTGRMAATMSEWKKPSGGTTI